MSNTIEIRPVEVTKTFSCSKQELFEYFTNKSLVEKWSAPDGMTLRVPVLEPKAGGKYRYEHTSEEGEYICVGHYNEVSPDRIVQVDETIQGPDGKPVAENLEGTITVTELENGVEARVVQKGFKTQEDADQCKEGWGQCFAHLEQLLIADLGEGRQKAIA